MKRRKEYGTGSGVAQTGSSGAARKTPRLVMDSSAPSVAPNRFGFGFRGPALTKAGTTTSNARVDGNQAEATAENGSTNASSPLSTARTNVATLTGPQESHVPLPSSAPPQSVGRFTSTQAMKPSIAMNSSLLSRNIPSGSKNLLFRRTTQTGAFTEAPASCEKFGMEKENNNPASPEDSTRLYDVFVGLFSEERISALENQLKFRAKANKFDIKARDEEKREYIRQLLPTIRTLCEEIRTFGATVVSQDDRVNSERLGLKKKIFLLEEQVRNKDTRVVQSNGKLDLLFMENESLSQQNRDLIKAKEELIESEKEATSCRDALQEKNNQLQAQLQQAQKQNEDLSLELKMLQESMANREQLYEEKKKELQQFYEQKELEDDKRKNADIEKLQSKLNKVREEMAAAYQERDSLKQKNVTCEEELKRERERRSQVELEKCTLETKNQSLEARFSSGVGETTELKEKLKQKDEELSNLVKSMTEIQKLTSTATIQFESEKKALLDKIESLQSANRDYERKEAQYINDVRDFRKQLETQAELRLCAERKEQDLHTNMKELESQLQETLRKLSVEESLRHMLENQARELRTEHVAVNAQMEAVKSEMKRLQVANDERTVQNSKERAVLEERFQEKLQQQSQTIDKLLEEKVSLESELETLRQRVSNVRDGDLEELCVVKREAEVLRLRLKELSNHGTALLGEKDKLIEELQEKVRQGDKTRRMMHNTIQELRGNVRVFARSRPFLPSDRCNEQDVNALVPVITCEYDGQSLKLRRPGKGSSSEQDIYSFTFDKVFPPSCGQDVVFEEVSEFVQSSLDGYHVCLFSYGQTGSGKTHTMQGSGNGQMRGIIPRAIENILSECDVLKTQGWKYTTKVSFLEIYNETLKDLLAGKTGGDSAKLAIKKDAKGGICVPDLTMVEVNAIEQVEALMERASRARSVACTDMNAQSSRSHSVFTVHIQGVHEADGIVLDGKLNLVDLAGSERASRSNVSGDRLKETQAINKSLSCLADVFTAIANKSAHVPFRNSKLTYLLQSSLSGDGKTLMMVNLSPTLESANESLCTLRFAQQVNQCELGKPKRQIKSKKDP